MGKNYELTDFGCLLSYVLYEIGKRAEIGILGFGALLLCVVTFGGCLMELCAALKRKEHVAKALTKVVFKMVVLIVVACLQVYAYSLP